MAPAWPILSIGIAGALDPALAVGDVAIDGEPELLQRLQAAWPDAKAGVIHGQDSIAATAEGKAALRRATGALTIDMESHVARAAAERQGVSFAAVRVISDTANDTLPPAALVGMKPDGGMALGAVLGSLAREPRQLPALIRTGINAGKAMRVLARVHHALERSGVFRLDLR
ncbi:phosphorylase [Novosphingobium sp. AAP93]|uniref:phosphorylase family protein n=1 Tax=Novosphingobium sp. AAP93 TaxID=1523427 RepID=UPI001E4B2EC7|nr:phosphorylase [Novosphingobium sp. AAP93]